jgi:hypothetical protein
VLYVFALATAMLLLPRSLRSADAPVDDEGFIRDWLMLAPIPVPDGSTGTDEIDKQQIKDESAIKPKEGDKQKVGDKEYAWKAIKAKDYYFDINEILGDAKENSIAYLVTYVVAPAEVKDVQALMGSNDEGKIYINGKEAVKSTEMRAIDKDQDTGKGITLQKGVNVIVFKVINETNNWQGCLRFADSAGKPLKDLKVKTAP